jgi:hypothetical protein
MNPGRELDALIAEKVMGWKPQHGIHLFPPTDEPNRKRYEKWNGETMITEIPHYSTNIADTWLVVEKMKEQSFHMLILTGPDKTEVQPVKPGLLIFTVTEKTPELAICKAALKAVEVEM